MENSTPGTPEHQSIKSMPEDSEFLDLTTSHGAESSEVVISDQVTESITENGDENGTDEPTSDFVKQHESSSSKSDNEDTSSGSSSETSIAPARVESMWADTTPYVAKKVQSWFQLPDGTWDLVTIIKTSGNESLIKLSEAKVLKVNHDTLVPANPDILDGVDDLMQLGFLNEPSVLYNLQNRYDRDLIYTKAGPVLVAVNPLKEVPLYGDEYVQAYRRKKMEGPHVYAIADTAMSEMIRDEVNQSIIISGESGAGKTETAKIAMQYLATLCGGSGIEYEILKTNPILESFGNAKTARNNNSSRFGKLIEIHFSENGKICGAQIQTFLLEKSRVVLCTEGERSYHIFYQLCAGAPSSLKEKLNLKSATEYKYLSQSSCSSIPGVDDAEQFHIVEEALDVVHISKDNQEKIFAMVAAVLWLGEISFTVIDDEDHVEAVEDEGLVNVASLLGCDIEELKCTLSIRKMDVGEENIVQKLTLTQAIDSRDALAKSIYSCLFDWLVEQINKSLAVGKRCTGRSINILDIYGFESFGRNSFEQLCINYANERLQQHFNRHLFKLDQEEYIQDGIDWAKIEFEDNQECLNLFEKKPVGLLSLLDEETTFPSATDATFALKLKQHLKFSSCFRAKRGGAFSVSHYAGEVTYHTSGFLDKNRDFLHLDFIQLLSSCKSDLPQIFASAMLSQSDLHKSGGADAQKLSVASKFKGQLFQLMQRLENTTSHFIRCIKPNNLQSPGMYDQGLVLQQLRCCGVLEVVRISRSGFPTRMSHKKFARRYGFLLLDHIASQDPLTVSVAILHQFNILPEMYHVGYTKLFFRTGQMGMLEDLRTRTLNGILRVQSCFRGHQARCKVRVQLRAIATIQALVQGGKTRKMYAYLVHRHRAAIVIQKKIKGRKERERFEYLRNAAFEMQAVVKGWMVRQCSGDIVLQQFGKKGKQVWVKATYLAELQHKVLKSESALRDKDEANEILSQRIQQYDSRWSEYERKMKSMEQVWQNQMTSLQSSLAGENTSSALEDENEGMGWDTANAQGSSPGGGPANPGLTVVNRLAEEFQQRSQVFSDDANFLVEVKSGQVQANLNPERELKELKHMFETWKKDYSARLRETKVVLNKIGREEASALAGKKTWWGRRNSSRMN